MESSLNLALPLTPSQGPYPLIPPRELQISPCLKACLKRPLQMEGVSEVAPARLPSEFLLVEGRKESCQPLKSERKKGLFKRLKVTRIRARGIRLQRQMGYQANFLDSSPTTHTPSGSVSCLDRSISAAPIRTEDVLRPPAFPQLLWFHT